MDNINEIDVTVTNKGLDALRKKAEKLMEQNPKLREHDRQMMEDLMKGPATEEEIRKECQDLLNRKMSGESGIQAEWEYIIQWLKGHPNDKSV